MDPANQRFEFASYCIVGLVLDAIKRNGLEATLEDLRQSCRSHPNSDEATYRDFLDVVNRISERCDAVNRS
jgi:hypothetical protein